MRSDSLLITCQQHVKTNTGPFTPGTCHVIHSLKCVIHLLLHMHSAHNVCECDGRGTACTLSLFTNNNCPCLSETSCCICVAYQNPQEVTVLLSWDRLSKYLRKKRTFIRMDLVFTLYWINFIDYLLLYESGFRNVMHADRENPIWTAGSAGALMMLLCRGHSQFVNTPFPFSFCLIMPVKGLFF